MLMDLIKKEKKKEYMCSSMIMFVESLETMSSIKYISTEKIQHYHVSLIEVN